MKALIMAGGQGTRFWPLSVAERPKQFLRLTGERTMLQETVRRLQPLMEPGDVFVVASDQYVPEIERQLPEVEGDRIVVEPSPRNTAACIGLAMREIRRRFPEEIVAVLPADHTISDIKGFHRALLAAEQLARQGWLVTFGIRPSFPATGFGYLRRGAPLDAGSGAAAFQVAQFTEKPDAEVAQSFVDSGEYFWNGGMFIWSVTRFWEELELFMPQLVTTLVKMDAAEDPEEAAARFSSLDRISIDYGLMERTRKAALIACDIGWNDLGGWKAIREVRTPDEDGNIAEGLLETADARDCLVVADASKLVALVGVSDLIVVDTPRALLVCSADRTEEVREIVRKLNERDLGEYC